MNCPNCQQANPDTAKFCMSCGTKVEKKCHQCGTEYTNNDKFCMECGERLANQVPTISKRKKPPLPQTAERRQLTVMFCTIVESTKISNQLDAEEFRQLLLDYQQLAKKVITRYGGYIAQYMDSGLLVYFGYPKGLEDAPKSAIRCGLGLNEALKYANKQWGEEKKQPLALQIGIHTGLVVVDYHLALGDTTNIAARIVKLAPPNEVVISKSTKKIVEGWFDVRSMGKQALKGIAKPIEVFQVEHDSGYRSRFEIAMNKGLTPLVGRETEMQMLQSIWKKAYAGQGQIVLVNGEAGIGKSRLVESVKQEIVIEPNAWLIEVHCSSTHQHTVFYPIVQLIENVVLKFEADDTLENKTGKLEGFLLQAGLPLTTAMPLFLELLSLPPSTQYPRSTLSPAGKKKQVMDAMIRILINRAKLQPILLIIEDLHWADPSTLEWINLFVDQLPTYSIMTLCTTRPTFQAGWLDRSRAVQLKLHGLSESKVEIICQHQCKGKALPPDILNQIIQKTDGIPLFVEELTRMVLDSQMLIEKEDAFELNGALQTLSIPSTLQDSLIARLDQLEDIKELTQIGSVLGREFSYGLLHLRVTQVLELQFKDAITAHPEILAHRRL